MTPRGTLGLCCVHIAQLVIHPAVYTLPFTLQICYKPLGIFQWVTNSQRIHISSHDALQNFIRQHSIMFTIFWAFLMVEQIFLSLQVKRTVINLYVWVAERLKTWDFWKLGNVRKIVNLYRLSAQSFSRNEKFVSTNKNLLKNRSWTFPIVRYFTWKLEFVSNIFWMIVA